jgi:hypothetical protein
VSDEREAKIQDVLLILRHQNFMRYGINDVNEAYVRGLSDQALEHIIDNDRQVRGVSE